MNAIATERVLVSGSTRSTHTASSERVRRIAQGLSELGIEAGDAVAILMRNEIAFVEASAAVSYLGAYAVPLNWHLAPEEIGYVMGDCDAKVLFAHADLLVRVPDELLSGNVLTVIGVEPSADLQSAFDIDAGDARCPDRFREFEVWLSSFEPRSKPALPAPESLLYTSGTTGKPKGVRRSLPSPENAAKIISMRETIYGIRREAHILVPGPLYHSAPNLFAIHGYHVADALVIMPRFDPETLLQLIEQYRITDVVMVPTMFVRLLRLPEEVRGKYDLSSLRAVRHAAAPCAPSVKRAMIDWFGPILEEWYGATETAAVTHCRSDEWLAHPGTVGRPIAGARIRILDDNGQDAPQGQPGEIFMGLEYYLNFTYHKRDRDREEITRDGLVTAGDIGFFDKDGYLFLCDRKKDLVISGGANIYPAEIESVLLGLGSVLDCTVFGIPDSEFGESLLALVVASGPLSDEDIRAYLRGRLASYKIPKRIEFRESLPRDDAGKILKRRLREPYWAGRERMI